MPSGRPVRGRREMRGRYAADQKLSWPVHRRNARVARRLMLAVIDALKQLTGSGLHRPPQRHVHHDGPLSAQAGSGNPTDQMQQLRRQSQARMPLFAAQGACGRLVQCTACLTILYLRRREHKVPHGHLS